MEKAWPNHQKVKCDCGHYPRDHFAGEGCCTECGCTWYYPNYEYVLKQQKKETK